MVAMAELRTQMSLCTCLPSCAPPANTCSKFPLAQLVVLKRWWHVIGQKNYRHNKNHIQQLPTNPSYKQMQKGGTILDFFSKNRAYNITKQGDNSCLQPPKTDQQLPGISALEQHPNQ
ncbi:hypothetical protein E2C01_033936 [Portunus trituberculatus]|uniref:Uncharacterized protein n=1 Tax=Portunus trituberculatus TaxID=210409 RepID=A0A5B7EZ77_PORTR|nr:hypothetical protein [Portunus trituberculatus]